MKISKQNVIKLLGGSGLQLFMPDKHGKHSNVRMLINRDFKITSSSYPNKPIGAFWTSTAIKKKNGYSSGWIEFLDYIQDGRSDSPWDIQPNGYLFAPKSPKLLVIASKQDAEAVFEKYKHPKFSRDFYIYDWEKLAEEYDGVHLTEKEFRPIIDWDCESTAWFNTKCLTYKGQVRIDK